MRIITGKYRGKKLFFPKDKKFRPTQDMVKESIFNIIGPSKCEGTSCLDLFSGTGSLGIEAFSRGAQTVYCVDRSDWFLRKNIDLIQSDDDDCLIRGVMCKVSSFLSTNKTSFDIIFMDPPWSDIALYTQTLKQIISSDILAEDGLILCLHGKVHLIKFPSEFIVKEYRYGDTILSVLKLLKKDVE